MKIIHVEGGLGNQMACYSVYVATKTCNPNEDIYIDTYIYDVKEAHSIISMWNGYELGTVFGVNIPNVKTLFSAEQVEQQIEYLRKSKFWDNNWNYADTFIKMMEKYDIYLQNAYGNVGENYIKKPSIKLLIKKMFRKLGAGKANTLLGYKIKQIVHLINKKCNGDCGKYLLESRKGNFFYDITLDFMKSPYLHKKIGKEVRSGLVFRKMTDDKNIKWLNRIRACNSISMHIRRTDYLQFNEDCYKYGFFSKCVKYIKTHITLPVFFLFSDDLGWCRENLSSIGLSTQDSIYFVDINSGDFSFKDMQLIANCKHNIATKSSFGWWGSFMNDNPNKITICQTSSYIATIEF